MRSPYLSIILPTYNESQNILPLISQISAVCHRIHLSYEIMVIDDDSPDTTGKLVRSAYHNNKSIKVIIRRNERGLATAIKRGFTATSGKYVLVMDTDFNHNPTEIPRFFNQLKKHHLVIGSRFIRNGGMENKSRYWLSYMYNLGLCILLQNQVHDNLSGFFMIKRRDLLQLDSETIFVGFGDYFIRLIYLAYKKGYTLAEIPVFYKNRVYGQSKSQFLKMLITYTWTALKLRYGTY